MKNDISFIFDSKIKFREYCPNFLPWKFWQIIGYPVSVSIVVECSQEEIKLVKKIIRRLPAGQIFSLNKIGTRKKITLLAIVQLRNNVDRFFENIIPVMNELGCKYTLSPIIPLLLYKDKLITNNKKKDNF